jgi:hypothetical protein
LNSYPEIGNAGHELDVEICGIVFFEFNDSGLFACVQFESVQLNEQVLNVFLVVLIDYDWLFFFGLRFLRFNLDLSGHKLFKLYFLCQIDNN